MKYLSQRKLRELMDEYQQAWGWDLECGWPTAETLERLGLHDLLKEMKSIREKAADIVPVAR
jgi:aldehyde:ferredoxin oxidoreductase